MIFGSKDLEQPTTDSNTATPSSPSVVHRPAPTASTPLGNLLDSKNLWAHQDLHLNYNPGDLYAH